MSRAMAWQNIKISHFRLSTITPHLLFAIMGCAYRVWNTDVLDMGERPRGVVNASVSISFTNQLHPDKHYVLGMVALILKDSLFQFRLGLHLKWLKVDVEQYISPSLLLSKPTSFNSV
ncbi:hypothetical protein BO71DRAFT_205185 [Aspergillus ellipticus CBS 707.79]|uniref:Uncharacterized protein n=1 Tax=Aspergillus ellipticus CBS 707.79 TaxID=1448320 RepID=A0A319DD88_9EURO|nr:hypothetical protein BO71DRAFT_205185 [Aspergillus ellipticus CBS 707.79]